MVTIINTNRSLRHAINYNENKVKTGAATCIGAGNYPVDVDKMNDIVKLNHFMKRIELNDKVKSNSIHISLNFAPSESHSEEKMMAIAHSYMEKIGFGKQPYLVYQHHDAGHPHLHVVTTNIERDGKCIYTHNLATRKSEPARKEIEELFGLIIAEGRKKKEEFNLQPIVMGKIQYGKVESKKAIADVLNMVLNQYKYASLPELNAVLKQYNIMADRGSENSKMFINKGLVYKTLVESGKQIGVPIKASDFYNKPTLKFLEEKFKSNEVRRMPDKIRIKNSIDIALLRQKAMTVNKLVKILEKVGINTVFKRNEEGFLSEITYVDHVTKSVFNGSALGKRYSAEAIQERCELLTINGQQIKGPDSKKSYRITSHMTNAANNKPSFGDAFLSNKSVESNAAIGKVPNIPTQFEQTAAHVPNQLKAKRKKRRTIL
ncbi:relaxase/mobilization nuclease domain-containing protein [Flavobacterium sp. XS2P39]|uniref:relaxase/mobilization nuclease domain-containing protein n=1 Tax=Flavobacterium sp. XS2P39 TaxID=3401725 RepID=UPI003AADD0E8